MDTVDMNQNAETLVDRVARTLYERTDRMHIGASWDGAEPPSKDCYRERARVAIDMCKAEGANLWTRAELMRMAKVRLDAFDLNPSERAAVNIGQSLSNTANISNPVVMPPLVTMPGMITVSPETVGDIDGVLMEAKPQRLHKKDRRTLARIEALLRDLESRVPVKRTGPLDGPNPWFSADLIDARKVREQFGFELDENGNWKYLVK